MFGISVKRVKNDENSKLAKIEKLLFPPYINKTHEDGAVMAIDTSADGTLEAVISDIEEGHVDALALERLRSVAKRLALVRQLMGAFNVMHPDTKFFVVDVPENQIPDVEE